eukprot:g38394.t1
MSTADAISLALHSSLEHLDNKDTYVRLHLIDYSSAFNTIDNCASSTITLNTGVPQGYVLSPLVYNLYAHDCVAKFQTNAIYKFVDDTTLVAQEIWHIRKDPHKFYQCTTESILFRYCSAQDHKKLQKIVCTAQTITEANLSSMAFTCTSRFCGKAANIIKDPNCPKYP